MTRTRDQALRSRVAALVESLQPRSLLLIAPEQAPPPSSGGGTAALVTGVEALHHLEQSERYDLALVDSAADIPAVDVAKVLSRLRDLKARRVLVIARDGAGEPWTRRALVGLGFTPCGEDRGRAGDASLYRFDIATYKTTPDWLNPRQWAHPELWDRYRW